MVKTDDELTVWVQERVDAIIALADPEEAHSQEDVLYLKLLSLWAPLDILIEITRLREADFPRWYA